MSRPKEYRFSDEVKLEALRRSDFRCENCGRHKTETAEHYLQAHHLLAVSMAVRHYPELAPALVASLANIKILCADCHVIYDQEAMGNHQYYAKELKKRKLK